VARAREELEALAGRPVAEVTAQTDVVPDEGLLVGTEALLHRVGPSDGVTAAVFVDFDQELLAGRVRAGPEALGLLAGASRLVRGRAGRVLVQTRMPDHPVIRSALLADPGVLAEAELEVRAALRLPPFTAVAVVSGEAAGEFAAGLATGQPALEILGPDRDRWLVKAPDADSLARALADTPRPGGGLRVAVDPSRL
jgi:primosomal protein N' (replication factor Y) (superfamily II helicase)